MEVLPPLLNAPPTARNNVLRILRDPCCLLEERLNEAHLHLSLFPKAKRERQRARELLASCWQVSNVSLEILKARIDPRDLQKQIASFLANLNVT